MPLSETRVDAIGRRVDWALLTVMGALFVYALLRLLGSLGADAPFQPRRFAVLTGAMLLQPTSALLMRRSRRVGYALLALSLVALAAASVMAS
jgi:glucose-6-phosphate-specific signal transduction histidine kinase